MGLEKMVSRISGISVRCSGIFVATGVTCDFSGASGGLGGVLEARLWVAV